MYEFEIMGSPVAGETVGILGILVVERQVLLALGYRTTIAVHIW